jgi:hypothetical protein
MARSNNRGTRWCRTNYVTVHVGRTASPERSMGPFLHTANDLTSSNELPKLKRQLTFQLNCIAQRLLRETARNISRFSITTRCHFTQSRVRNHVSFLQNVEDGNAEHSTKR